MKTLTEQDYINAAKELGCEVAAIKAVAEVESRGTGFLSSGEPKILFERHRFYKYTGGKYYNKKEIVNGMEIIITSNNDICNKTPGGYGKESDQHTKLQRASVLNREAALMSCSWGKFQVMGDNWQKLGYKSLQEFINKMYDTEAGHLDSCVRYIKNFGLLNHIRNKNWAKFAYLYNGSEYEKNNYNVKMKAAYNKYSK